MKSVPFMIVRNIPVDIYAGEILDFDEGKSKVTAIKSVKFLDMRTMKIIGMCKPIQQD